MEAEKKAYENNPGMVQLYINLCVFRLQMLDFYWLTLSPFILTIDSVVPITSCVLKNVSEAIMIVAFNLIIFDFQSKSEVLPVSYLPTDDVLPSASGWQVLHA